MPQKSISTNLALTKTDSFYTIYCGCNKSTCCCLAESMFCIGNIVGQCIRYRCEIVWQKPNFITEHGVAFGTGQSFHSGVGAKEHACKKRVSLWSLWSKEALFACVLAGRWCAWHGVAEGAWSFSRSPFTMQCHGLYRMGEYR